jgi:hypothetical protein
MVAHDSEGFEAGTTNEVDVVKKFIERRSKAENVNERLHLVWFVKGDLSLKHIGVLIFCTF